MASLRKMSSALLVVVLVVVLLLAGPATLVRSDRQIESGGGCLVKCGRAYEKCIEQCSDNGKRKPSQQCSDACEKDVIGCYHGC
ncbi:hypothetical protein ACLB2K_042351 [Fragaria x ananassa]